MKFLWFTHVATSVETGVRANWMWFLHDSKKGYVLRRYVMYDGFVAPYSLNGLMDLTCEVSFESDIGFNISR